MSQGSKSDPAEECEVFAVARASTGSSVTEGAVFLLGLAVMGLKVRHGDPSPSMATPGDDVTPSAGSTRTWRCGVNGTE